MKYALTDNNIIWIMDKSGIMHGIDTDLRYYDDEGIKSKDGHYLYNFIKKHGGEIKFISGVAHIKLGRLLIKVKKDSFEVSESLENFRKSLEVFECPMSVARLSYI